jgi:hypothetical protein
MLEPGAHRNFRLGSTALMRVRNDHVRLSLISGLPQATFAAGGDRMHYWEPWRIRAMSHPSDMHRRDAGDLGHHIDTAFRRYRGHATANAEIRQGNLAHGFACPWISFCAWPPSRYHPCADIVSIEVDRSRSRRLRAPATNRADRDRNPRFCCSSPKTLPLVLSQMHKPAFPAIIRPARGAE